jgi:hypothetical protein
LALGAYYCGVFGLIPILGIILAPIAIVLGILGLRYSRRNPKARGQLVNGWPYRDRGASRIRLLVF